MKNPTAFLVALIVAGLSTFAQCRYVAERERELLQLSELKRTVVATRNVRESEKLDETMFEIQEIPAKWQQPQALEEVDLVVGQISSSPILQGEHVLATKLLRPSDAGLAYFVPSQSRAVAVYVNVMNAVGGHIRPGNFVDVLGTFDFGRGESSDFRTVTLFQNVWVLSVGNDIGQAAVRSFAPGEEGGGNSDGLQGNPTITLAVSADEAQKLIMAQSVGDLSLSLRSLWETEKEVKLSPATIPSTLGISERVRSRRRKMFDIQ